MGNAQLLSIHVHPVKAFRGLAPREAEVEPWGLAGDRRWALVDDGGKVVSWSLEGFPPNTLLRTGWSQKDLKQGDVITFEGCTARDGSSTMLAREITLANGQKKYWGPMQ